MKRSTLDLPPEIASQLLRARRWSGPPLEATDRMRARLDWAFIETGPSKVVYTPERRPLREVPAPEKLGLRWDRWTRNAARAAAALIVAHIPLALASLGVAIAAVPVTRVLLTRAAGNRGATHQIRRIEHRHVVAAQPASPGTEAQPPSPALLVVPSLAPLPESFPAEQLVPVEPRSSPPTLGLPLAAPTFSAPVDLHKDVALATERQYLERARRSLVRADPVGALAELREHRVRYPESQLSEEREALTVEALLRSGRVGEARLRAEELRHRFPRSLLLPALDAALSPNR
jgi:hypothetical protein